MIVGIGRSSSSGLTTRSLGRNLEGRGGGEEEGVRRMELAPELVECDEEEQEEFEEESLM